MAEQYDVQDVDNRDQRTTWLWITQDYVEVDPIDLMENMIENCYNEDVLFLFERFRMYLDHLDDTVEVIKSDRSRDHIVQFRNHLNSLIVTRGQPGNPDE